MTFMTSVGRGNGEVLKFATCLHILLFLNGRYVVYLPDGVVWAVVGGRRGRHYMILNIKTSFSQKVALLALVL